MNKTYKIIAYSLITALFSCGAVLTSCSSDNDVETPQGEEKTQTDDGRKLRQLTIENVAMTRATLTDNGSTMSAAWEASDEVSFLNVTAHKSGYAIGNYSGLLTASASASTSAFTGSVKCNEEDWIGLFYPSNRSTDGRLKHETYARNIQNSLITEGTYSGRYVIALFDQKGTLADIQENYHYVYGVAQVTSVYETTATAATRADMKSLLSLCKFTFTDGTNNIPVNELVIKYCDVDTKEPEGYPLLGTVKPTNGLVEKEKTDPETGDKIKYYDYELSLVNAIVDEGEALDRYGYYSDGLVITPTSAISDGVYVALFPDEDTNNILQFTVTSGSDTYMARFTPNLVAGKFYPATLTLTKQ